MRRRGSILRFICLIFLAGMPLSAALQAQSDEYIRRYISVQDGLSQNEITTIGKDKYGFMWFGTRGGLNRFDGVNFKTFKPERNSATSILNPSIETLLFDSRGRAWIGTKSGGISIYDPVTETFTAADSIISDLPNRVVSIYEDTDGVFWIGGFYDGLISYNPVTGQSDRWLSDMPVQSILQTPDGTIWVGARNSLRYKRPGDTFRQLSLQNDFFTITDMVSDQEEPMLWITGWGLPLVQLNYQDLTIKSFSPELGSANLHSLLNDPAGNIWVGTWGYGLYRFDKVERKFEKINIYPDARFSQLLDYEIILDLYMDSEGVIWVGTDGGGVVQLGPSRGFNATTTFPTGLKYHVTSIMRTDRGEVIFGSRDQGLKLDRGDGILESIKVQGEPGDSESQNVYSIINIDGATAWIGMESGLYVLSRSSSGDYRLIPASRYFNSPALEPRIAKVHDVEQRGDELWVATQQRGLFQYAWDGTQYDLVNVFNSNQIATGLNSNRVTTLLTDKNGMLWAGTYNGLYRYSDTDSLFEPLGGLLEGVEAPLCNIVLTASRDNEGAIWFGTPCSLNRLIRNSEDALELEEFTMGDGLPNDYISNVLSDVSGNTWITTNSGISKIEKETGNIYNFGASDGTGSSNFSESASFIAKDDEIFFGSFAGYAHFYPSSIEDNLTEPPVAFTSFKILNREVKVSADGILPVSINEAKRIVLDHNDREISFEFAALEYRSPGRNQYMYKLERNGEEADWDFLGTRRMISYQNLKSGEYTLFLKGSNSDGVWNQNSRELRIRVLSSPWQRWYAIVGYILFILLVIALIIQISLMQERLKNQAQMEQVKLAQAQQMNEYKLRFFTNISHELRTPLSMILAPLNELLRGSDSGMNRDSEKKLGIIKKNAERLLKLINQLIEFRKAEVGSVKLQAAERDITSFMKEIVQPFEDLATQKGITFYREFKGRKVVVYFDVEKLSVVVNNLLNNAIKYCGDPGNISVTMEDREDEVVVIFENDGKGIKPKDIEHVFDRFFRVSSSSYMNSSGIGLALAKNYMEMHKGSIAVESTPNERTTFKLYLKKGVNHLEDGEISPTAEGTIQKESFLEVETIHEEKTKFHHKGTKGAQIAVIDDNADVRNYLKDLLSAYYEVLTAENGQDGFDLIVETVPDLILSDVMMPEMDGYELCEKVKAHRQLSHIPFAMLTAKDTASDMIFGAKKGADYYITKPFDPDLILEKVRQILSSRKELEQKYSRKVVLDPTDKEISTEDERILKMAISVVEKNIENEQLNLSKLASEMAMSSSTLFRKMKAITGQSPGEFIKSVRFKRAAQLLRDSDLAVSEIIEQVGYRSVKQFRENFKAEYGTSPATYRKQFREGASPEESRPETTS